ncbi:MAG: hypothetical protein QM564_01640 [Bergeyella sp.]
MVATLKKGDDKKNMLKMLEKLTKSRKRKKVDIHKYCGVIKLKEDALSIQKKMRDEWD